MTKMRCLAFVAMAGLVASGQAAWAWESRHADNGWRSSWRSDYAPPARRLYESGNSCAPDHAEAVWGDGNALLGYSCERESANGG